MLIVTKQLIDGLLKIIEKSARFQSFDDFCANYRHLGRTGAHIYPPCRATESSFSKKTFSILVIFETCSPCWNIVETCLRANVERTQVKLPSFGLLCSAEVQRNYQSHCTNKTLKRIRISWRFFQVWHFSSREIFCLVRKLQFSKSKRTQVILVTSS